MEPQTIIDAAIPLLNGGTSIPMGSASNPVLSESGAEVPTSHLDQKFPVAIIAQETISQSLNTETKRILAEYTFESLGAFSVYSSTHPLAHITMSGDGIVGVDANGNTTFFIDGETGNATFMGTLQAGTIIGGDTNVIIGNGGSGGGRIVLYNSGVPVILIGDPS